MSRYVVVASLRRGGLAQPEPVDQETQDRLEEADRLAGLPQFQKIPPRYALPTASVQWRSGYSDENRTTVRQMMALAESKLRSRTRRSA